MTTEPKMSQIREALESIRTLHTFDLVDFSDTSDAFKRVALRGIVPIIGDPACVENLSENSF